MTQPFRRYSLYALGLLAITNLLSFVNRNVEVEDDALGFAVSLDLNPQKARLLLALLIANGVTDPRKGQQAFEGTF